MRQKSGSDSIYIIACVFLGVMACVSIGVVIKNLFSYIPREEPLQKDLGKEITVVTPVENTTPQKPVKKVERPVAPKIKTQLLKKKKPVVTATKTKVSQEKPVPVVDNKEIITNSKKVKSTDEDQAFKRRYKLEENQFQKLAKMIPGGHKPEFETALKKAGDLKQLRGKLLIHINKKKKLIDGNSLLHVAAEANNKHAVRILLEYGLTANDLNDYQMTPLHLTRGLNVAKLLLPTSKNINARDIFGNSPLHDNRHLKVAVYFMRQGMDTNARNRRGRTPIYYSNNPKFFDHFLEHGTKLDIEDHEGYTPYDTVMKNHNRFLNEKFNAVKAATGDNQKKRMEVGLSFRKSWSENKIYIERVAKESSAFRKINVNDEVLSLRLDDKSEPIQANKIDIYDYNYIFFGPEGSFAELTLKSREGKIRTIKVERRDFNKKKFYLISETN